MRVRRATVLTALTTLTLSIPLFAPSSPASAAADRADAGRADVGRIRAAPVAEGYGGAISTVDATATSVGLDVLRRGGNAVDAAVAAAATLGVTEPFSAGIGGGGFLVYYDARKRTVYTIDGREAAPMAMGADAFVDPATGKPYDFQEARISGISVGVPGTLLTWQEALRRWGTRSLAASLAPAAAVAQRGFPVDQTFHDQIADPANHNDTSFAQFSSTRALYLPGGQAPAVGSTFRNPDLAATYRLIAREGVDAFYRGRLGRDIVNTVQHPPVAANPAVAWQYPIRPGAMVLSDLENYRVRFPAPTRSEYRGLDVYGMATPSSGGTTVGEALNILERSDLRSQPLAQALHRYLEASALAFADRNRYIGDYTPRATLDQLLSDGFAAERACLIDPAHALPKPVAPGVPDGSYGGCAQAPAGAANTQGTHTTNLTVADRWGNVVEYTLTIEQTGGNAMVVPGRGFLLNNELTDFNFTPTQGDAPDPNLPAPGKRPRSSMSPTIVLQDGKPFLAVGSPGGSTIITTVLQILVGRLDLGLSLPDAIAAPRASQRNTASVQAEPAFLAAPEAAALTRLGHTFTTTPEIGAATGIEFERHGRMLAAAEPTRRGGGAAAVVRR
ncbi:gamma-glutamyltransferase [Planosporangium thailandense]|uniref:Glutathione hydrolase proenzyme n=1 Tax=Planosporangium thailandense TaxID=765197 RepID=A0ABX0Y2R7_9ACTN|nr:gamma-glutamyltransferase [Planosporangium thailandense]NJC71720.1 gamma-glutamyltransferase [Planosporangium thailandense]